jgi:PKD repeat protein
MKKYFNHTSALLIVLSIAFSQCQKSRVELVGSASEAAFTFVQSPASDTLPYPYKVSFINNSSEAFIYQWNFGDNAALSAEENPEHIYKAGGTYNVTLTTVGTYGNSAITKVLFVTDACQNEFFNNLTSCATGEWTWSADNDAIKVFYADGTSLFSTNAAVDCQLDDVFKFSANGTFAYESNGQTYNQSTASCGNSIANATGYKVITSATQAPRIVLNDMEAGLGNPFIGTTDEVEGNSYEVKSYSASTLILKATLKNTGGKIIEIKLKKRADLTIADIKDILTGGSSRSWKLDASTGANAIVVGTEGNPSEYYGGGPLEPNCQVDDVYTFTSADNLNYNANGSTFNGGNIAPNYNCGADRSFTTNFVFGPVVGGAAGIASIQLPGIPPTNFIGTTDVPAENLYRIIEITPSRLLLRAGSGAGTVFQFKFVRQ